MISHRVCGGRLPLKALSVAVGLWVLFDSSVVADDSEFVVTNQGQVVKKEKKVRHTRTNGNFGTLGYGAAGLYPGFQGFGLGYHLGYGYGGDALGVGAEGDTPSTGALAIPTPRRRSAESVESILSPITWAQVIPPPTIPTITEASAHSFPNKAS